MLQPREDAGRMPRWIARVLGDSRTIPLALAVMLVAIGAQIAFIFKVPSWGNDEPAHVGYIAALAEGNLPTIDTDIVDDPARFPGTAVEFQGWDEAHGDIWTANHPPIYHLMLVPIWWASSGDQTAMIVTMRLVNTVGFGLWLLLVFLIARALVPQRPAVAAVAAVVAVAPTLAMRSGYLMNDGFGSSAALLAILMTIRMLRDRVTPLRLGVAALAGSLAAGTRAPGVLVVAVCTFAVLFIAVRQRGWWRGVAAAAVVGGVPALVTGWFYLRNVRLYGDLTGQDALLEKFVREPMGAIRSVDDVRGLSEPLFATPIPLLALAILGPIALVATIRRHGVRVDGAWLLLGVLTLLTGYNIVGFLQAGGGFHDRYLMQVMPFLATAAALAMLDVGRWRRTAPGRAERRDWLVATGWSAVLLAWLGGTLWWLEDYYIFSRQSSLTVDGVLPDLLVAVAALSGLLAVTAMASRAVRVAWAPVPHLAVDGQSSAEPAR